MEPPHAKRFTLLQATRLGLPAPQHQIQSPAPETERAETERTGTSGTRGRGGEDGGTSRVGTVLSSTSTSLSSEDDPADHRSGSWGGRVVQNPRVGVELDLSRLLPPEFSLGSEGDDASQDESVAR